MLNISLKNFEIADCIHGTMVWPKGDSVLGMCLPRYGEWSEGENIIMSQFISKGDTVIDIGANLGTTVLSLSKQVSDKGKVLAFEPQSIMSQCLHTNLTLNDISNVSVFNIAISNETGWSYINDQDFVDSGRFGEAGISDEGTRIKTIRLDELELEHCSLVKIDVESHEWEVIQGGQRFLRKHKPVLYMEAKKEVKGTKNYLNWLFQNGWRCYWHYAFWYRVNNYNKNPSVSDTSGFKNGVGDMNIVAVPIEKSQPDNLLELKNYDDEWDSHEINEFYEKNKIKMI